MFEEEEGRGGYIITDKQPNQLTLNLAEDRVWIANDRSFPTALSMTSQANSALSYSGKIATVFEDPSVDASDIEIHRTRTQQLVIKGRGFTGKVRPILDFDSPLDSAKLLLKVESSSVMYLGLSRSQPAWTPVGNVGSLKVKGIDTGAGMVVFDPPVTVATFDSQAGSGTTTRSYFNGIWEGILGTNSPEEIKIDTAMKPSPYMRASSVVVVVGNTPTLLVHGANFNPENTTLYFDPPLPEDVAFENKVISPTKIRVEKIHYSDRDETRNRGSVWAFEPGPLKVVAIDTGDGLVRLNPEGGGVVVAEVKAGIEVQANESLRIYRSTKQIRVDGSGFTDGMSVQSAGGLVRGFPGRNDFTVTDVRPDQLTLNLAEGSTWFEDDRAFPAALVMQGGRATASCWWEFVGVIATVFEDPSIDASDVEIYRTRTQQLVIDGSGFVNAYITTRGNYDRQTVRTILEFDPPIDSANFNLKVETIYDPLQEGDREPRLMLNLNPDSTEPGWAPAGYSGPLKVKGIDTGAGMVMLDTPVTVATVVPDSNAPQESVLAAATPEANRAVAMKKQQDRGPPPSVSTAPPQPPYVEPEDSAVSVLLMDTFDDFVRADFAVVHFCRPSFFHCKRLFPEYTRASIELKGFDVAIKLGKVDVSDDANKPLFERFDRPYLPAVKIFRNGVEASGFSGFKDAAGIVAYLKTEKAKHGVEPAPPTPPAPSSMEPEDSAVSVLSDDNFHDFIKAEMAVVNFWGASWNGFSRRLAPEYTKASIELKRVDPTIRLGKVGTDAGGSLYRRFAVSSTPTIKIFRNDSEARDYKGPRDAAGIVDYLEAEKAKAIDTVLVPTPVVKASSEAVSMSARYFLVNGTNFYRARDMWLYFDPPCKMRNWRVESSTQIRVDPIFNRDGVVWPPEPGPLRIVAIDTGTGRINLNPTEGGVVIAMVQADPSSDHSTTVQDNEGLHVYQSTKQIQIAGSGFADNTEVRFVDARPGGGANFTVVDARPDQLTLSLSEGSTWVEDSSTLPRALVMQAAKGNHGWVPLRPKASEKLGPTVAIVFEDPSIDASDIEIHGAYADELEITGTGFNMTPAPVLAFDPPLDPAAVGIDVASCTLIRLRPLTSSGWTPRERFQGPLMIKGADTGAGMVMFESPVTVANFVPFSGASESGAQP